MPSCISLREPRSRPRVRFRRATRCMSPTGSARSIYRQRSSGSLLRCLGAPNAAVAALGAALQLVHTLLPGEGAGLLRSLTPHAVGPLSRAAGASVGLALLFAARGL